MITLITFENTQNGNIIRLLFKKTWMELLRQIEVISSVRDLPILNRFPSDVIVIGNITIFKIHNNVVQDLNSDSSSKMVESLTKYGFFILRFNNNIFRSLIDEMSNYYNTHSEEEKYSISINPGEDLGYFEFPDYKECIKV